MVPLTQFITMLLGKHHFSPRTSFRFQTCRIPLERVLRLRLRSRQRDSGILQELALQYCQTSDAVRRVNSPLT